MLIVTIHNDGTGGENDANYNCEVLVTVTSRELKTIATARVEGHRRGDGWRELLKRVIEEGKDCG